MFSFRCSFALGAPILARQCLNRSTSIESHMLGLALLVAVVGLFCLRVQDHANRMSFGPSSTINHYQNYVLTSKTIRKGWSWTLRVWFGLPRLCANKQLGRVQCMDVFVSRMALHARDTVRHLLQYKHWLGKETGTNGGVGQHAIVDLHCKVLHSSAIFSSSTVRNHKLQLETCSCSRVLW